MSFRTKLLGFFTLTIVAAVTPVAWGVSVYTRRAFEQFDHQRTEALVAQFRREYAQRGEEVAHRVQGIADAEATLRMAMDLSRPQADASQYYNDARGLAETQQLDFLDIVGDDGTLISSAEWPARFGYKNEWVGAEKDWNSQGAFLRRVDMPDTRRAGLARRQGGPRGRKTSLSDRRPAPQPGFPGDAGFAGEHARAVLSESRAGLRGVGAHRSPRPGGAGRSVRLAHHGSPAHTPGAGKENRLDIGSRGKLRDLQCNSADGPGRRFAGRPPGGKLASGSG